MPATHVSANPNLCVVYGNINASAGTAAVLTCNDETATLTRTAAGDYTVTFGQAFLSAPTCTASLIDATFATNKQEHVNVISKSTTTVHFNAGEVTLGVATGSILNALADGGDIDFICVGLRNF